MRILGLTGGIGMGKSNAAAVLRRAGLPVFDADAAVHRLQGRGGAAVRPIEAAFPGSLRDGAVDRGALRKAVLGDAAALKRLERIVHPLVRQAEQRFLARARRAGRRLAVLDVPLLLETGGERRVDHVVVVSAPARVQRVRVRRRGTMSAAQIDAVIARQMPDREKRRRADTVIHTGLSRHHTQTQLRRLVRVLRAVPVQVDLAPPSSSSRGAQRPLFVIARRAAPPLRHCEARSAAAIHRHEQSMPMDRHATKGRLAMTKGLAAPSTSTNIALT